MIVADTNLIAYFFIRGDRTLLAEKVFRRDPDWAAPLLWRSEFRNVLAFHMRRGLLGLEQSVQIAEKAETLMRRREYAAGTSGVLELAAGSRCSAYDCEFVAVARDLEIPLVTSDEGILRAFPNTAVSPELFAS